MTEALDNVHIVMVETSHPGNIGAAARAMKTMGLSRLGLINPKIYPHAEATALASGAADLLVNASVSQDFDQALEPYQLVIGASARRRTIDWPELTPRECAARLIEVAQSGPVVLLFGTERTGLSNEQMDRCHYLVHIPTNPEYSSLNVAAAVQVLAYEVRMAALAKSSAHGSPQREDDLVTQQELSGFYQHLEQGLIDLQFLDPANPRQLMRRLRRLFNRIHLEKMELNILRGILTAVQDLVRKRG